MRLFFVCVMVAASVLPCFAQGSPPVDPSNALAKSWSCEGTPPAQPSPGRLQEMTILAKKQLNQAIQGKTFPSIQEWQPLTTRQKFQYFVNHTYSPRTFANAAYDTLVDEARHGRNMQYERSWMGLGQHYGVNLATSETDVFFQRFLVPSILKQDPRYFRNPSLPFMQRALYSMSRVFLTRTDKGGETVNASRILGGTASQALADLYVPGERQGMHPIIDRMTFDLLRDAGFNLLHEFWPDMRAKFLHR